MKFDVKWTDLAEDCFPEELMLGEYDEARNTRIKENVMRQIQEEKSGRRSARKVIRVLPLVALLAVLFTVTAYAGGLFKIHLDPVPEGESVQGEWIERDEEGNITFQQNWTYDDAGMVFTFEGETEPHRIQFKPGWLPSEPDISDTYPREEDSWYQYLGDQFDEDESPRYIPWIIMVSYCDPYQKRVIEGETSLIREGELAGYNLTEVSTAPNEYREGQNYVLLMDEERGFMITIVGSDSFEDLEHIAEELEVRQLDELVPFDPDFNVGIIAAGRG